MVGDLASRERERPEWFTGSERLPAEALRSLTLPARRVPMRL